MTSKATPTTVSDVINAHFAALTRAERQLAETLLDNYPVSGLGSITTVAENAGVSTPTVARMVQKLGFKGFPDFQSRLHQELEATISNPITKHDRWAASAPGTHTLNRFADAAMNNMRETLAQIEPREFDEAVALIADRKRNVYLLGGRITRAVADYLFTHLQVIRPGVTEIASNASAWPHYVLDMRHGDVLILFDIRRYEQEMETLAKSARERGVEIVLFTDRWSSPVAKSASKVFRSQIEVPSAWDSSVVILFLVEALIEAVQSTNWDATRDRMKTLEGLFDSTRIFRKPV
ncbi:MULTISPECIES: MurR/RpiR family transcriptional regulator [Ensifer]|jgi:DNA-binding MurR/RpiR family transcriptional regulator|uniref:SIS domain-containing protein n=1 Tax=Ensifer canadensis TaxID=555315 RepID=A0AAW4FMH8_9HYPH|nr:MULTISPECIES: MurR/RpiR family transcriptional regulator [Ensifer]MDP9632384.1 DNA-binding MurR/RpiR family transcriptional regulator [Ensifer adhaerens]KQU73946.1 RpiR family transcriptional regulator [Ensifer sp. Root31]KQW58400.1 RpiR family transcriptional regulator [Ensifer sp. Root1252]KQW62359.1 RpiR family transcriptional regulator [Ensifer sp. Root127]KQY78375.1 RpiR family transcriptional regulator [Ensifer sp. Root142]